MKGCPVMIEKRTALITLGISLVLLGVWRLKSASAVPSDKLTAMKKRDFEAHHELTREPNVPQPPTLYDFTTKASRVCVLGDSQIDGALGDTLQATLNAINPNVTSYRLGIPGVTAKKLLNNSDYKSRLNRVLSEAQPDMVIVQLGDNGVDGDAEVKSLLQYLISKTNENTKIIWVGAHPKTIPMSKESKYVFTTQDKKDSSRYISNYNQLVSDWNERIARGVEQLKPLHNIYFVNPLLLFPFKKYSMTEMSFDGVHILEEPAKDFLEILFTRELE